MSERTDATHLDDDVQPPRIVADTGSCLACGEPVAPALRRLGSLRCHECRDNDVPLDPVLWEEWRQHGSDLQA